MIRWIVLLSVCIHHISASFDYIYEEHSFMGKNVYVVHLMTSRELRAVHVVLGLCFCHNQQLVSQLLLIFVHRPGGCAERERPSGGATAPSTGRIADSAVLL